MPALALDIGATKFAAARVHPDGTLSRQQQVPTPAANPWQTCAELLTAVAGDEHIEAVGISSAGPIDAVAGVVGPINIPEWRAGFALTDAVARLFPGARLALVIDGAAAALAEHLHGAGRGTPDLLGMVVSSGVGGGIVRAGRVVAGRTGNAGHIGHIPVPGGTEQCACGGVGCLEAVASGPSAVRWARANGWTGNTGVALAQAARSGDAIAVAAMARAGTALGAAIAGAAALLDVDLVVIGGGFAQSGPPLWEPLQVALTRHAGLNFLEGLRVLPAELASNASLVGAAALALPGQFL